MGPLDRMLQSLASRQAAQQKGGSTENEITSTATSPVKAPPTPRARKTSSIATPIAKKRQTHHVSTLSDRVRVTKWMINENDGEPKHLMSSTIRQFPECFSASQNANFMKAKRWWTERTKVLNISIGGQRSGRLVETGKKRGGGTIVHHVKSMSGRGRKTAQWFIGFHA